MAIAKDPRVSTGAAGSGRGGTGSVHVQMQQAAAEAHISKLRHDSTETAKNHEERLHDLESFIKYAADTSPEFNKLLVGYRAMKRIGVG